MLRLQCYDFTMNHVKGSLLTVADTLSRAPLKNKMSEIDNAEITSHIHLTESNYLISDFRLQQFKDETKSDETVQTSLSHIQNKWGKSKNDVPNLIRSYFIHRQDFLTYINGIVFKGIRMIVPKSLRENMKLHVGHLGIDKIKEKAHEIVYWPDINADLENIVNSCDTCPECQNQQKDESPIPHNIPTAPRTKVGTDLFELNGKSYLVAVDYTANFFDISLLLNKRSVTVVTHKKRTCSNFAFPKKVISYNGPEYIGKDYKLSVKQWNF